MDVESTEVKVDPFRVTRKVVFPLQRWFEGSWVVYDGLLCAGHWTVRSVQSSGRDMHRRKLPLGSVFAAAAFSEPTLLALTVPPAESTARAGGKLHREANTAFLTRSARRDKDPTA